jgi:hypothetical protein
MEGGSPITLVLIGSFAIDRIVTGLLFLLSLPPGLGSLFPDPALVEEAARPAAEKRRKLNYFLLAAVLSLPVVFYADLKIFAAMGFKPKYEILDTLLTALILIGGSDRIGDLLKTHASPVAEKPSSGGIEITGTVTVADGKGATAAVCPSCSAPLEAGSGYCHKCGARVGEAGAAVVASFQP